MVSYYRVSMIIVATVLFGGAIDGGTNFYVDPDWTGTKSGTHSRPFAVLDKSAWHKINTALANADVTIYFSALKADGATQQSKAWFIQGKRTDPSSHRLTLDGYSKYNSNETTPAWLANPDADINHAYLNGKVFKATGDGSTAIGWTRMSGTGSDVVTRNGQAYFCIESHVASSDKEPGVGANWRLYWDHHGSSTTPWSSGTLYKCYPKQNNVTIRGFEATGSGARISFAGDNLIFEYVWQHDVTAIDPGMTILYTSYPNDSSAKIIMRPSTNMLLHHFRIERTMGEGLYIGSINPGAPASFQAEHGNQHSHITIEDFVIANPGAYGGQGDGIDCKNGITYLTITRGEITGYGATGNGIVLPYSAINTDQHNLVERVFIHDSAFAGQGAQRCISAQTGGAHSTSLYGLVGLTIRNCICANSYDGIVVSGSTFPNQPVDQAHLFNNTVYNITNTGLSVSTNITNSVVKNNFIFSTGSPTGLIGSAGVVSDYNAHDGTWISANEGTHTLALTSPQAFASVVNPKSGDFRPSANSALKGKGLTIPGFSDDFYRRSRESGNWNIGAVQASGEGSAAPSGLQVVR